MPAPEQVRRRRLAALTGVLVAAVVAGLLLADGQASRGDPTTTTVASVRPPRIVTAQDPLRVLLLGDSLAWEAKTVFRDVLASTGKAEVEAMTFGGTNFCTFRDELRRYVRRERPEVVVIEFSGNSIGGCMTDPETGAPYAGDRLVEKFRADADETVRHLLDAGVQVHLASFPVTRSPHPEDEDLRQVLLDVAGDHPEVRYVDAAASVLGPDGEYVDFLPCLPGEPCTGTDPETGRPAARVRAPDGAHFCPNGLPAIAGVTLECEVWSSGAWRYGRALADPVLDAYRLRPDR